MSDTKIKTDLDKVKDSWAEAHNYNNWNDLYLEYPEGIPEYIMNEIAEAYANFCNLSRKEWRLTNSKMPKGKYVLYTKFDTVEVMTLNSDVVGFNTKMFTHFKLQDEGPIK